MTAMTSAAGIDATDHRTVMILTIARLLAGVRHVAVGASSPIPAAGAMLLRAQDPSVRISILGSVEHNFFTNGTGELFDCAAQGRIDAFFLGGGQIDGQGNVNLVGVGEHDRPRVRWPGCFGSSFLYYIVPRVILFREEHSRRVFVERVDYVSAAGTSESHVHRPGGPHALLTNLALFMFDRARGRFVLTSIHPGHTLEEIRDQTGFAFDVSPALTVTLSGSPSEHALLQGRVLADLAETYPSFAQTFRASAPA
jgi:glutaconate CoA-transferase subunit B